MSQITPLTPEAFAQASWDEHPFLHFARHQHFVPLVLDELASVLHQFPLAWIQTPEPQLIGVLGFQANHNLFITEDGRWRGDQLPLVYRTYPFVLATPPQPADAPSGKQKRLLCVDRQAPQVHADGRGEQAFYTPEGQPTAAVQARAELLKQAEQSRLYTAKASRALLEADLLTDWKVELETAQGKTQVNGLYRLNERRFNSLDDQSFIELRKSGALYLAHAALLSRSRLELLKLLHQRQASSQPQNLDLDQLFGEADDDVFKF